MAVIKNPLAILRFAQGYNLLNDAMYRTLQEYESDLKTGHLSKYHTDEEQEELNWVYKYLKVIYETFDEPLSEYDLYKGYALMTNGRGEVERIQKNVFDQLIDHYLSIYTQYSLLLEDYKEIEDEED